ncbi:MAG: chloramphenicol acetyltransferase [Clostridia bacterium]|nr:chloramphenicol acetyltransferase [Clostridia bacterium]
MINSYKIIDVSSWDRREHCLAFKNSAQPKYTVGFKVDVTAFYNRVKSKKLSFTLAMTHAVCKAAMTVEELRYRFMGDDVVLYDSLDTAFTYIDKGGSLYKFVEVPYCDDVEEYISNAERIIGNQKVYFTGVPSLSVIQCSALPWIDFTYVTHTEGGNKRDSLPIVDWGKFSDVDGKLIMPVSIHAHHSFVDGIHVAKFINTLQECLDN